MTTSTEECKNDTMTKDDEGSANEHVPSSSSSSNHVKRLHLKMFNSIKPSLSLTSLPPQSINEKVNEISPSTERPYNSLKKKRDIEQKELWRRSWESQNSISTTTSHTGTSNGKNDFWAAYNFIMDNSIIDSCKEPSGEIKTYSVKGELTSLKHIDKTFITPSPGSQGSQKVSDPRRLRRWLREMENRISKLPSLKEAMKLNANELKKFSIESNELYREINTNGRFVATCIRSLENTTKSVECSEFDSLDTNATSTTNTSNESKRSENILKALERRYHLLYLNAFEIQCMFEGLLDKRNFFNVTENAKQIETSDEEPIAKIPKYNENENFSSQKSSKCVDSDADADSEHSDEMEECIDPKSIDCVDSVSKISISPKTPRKETINYSIETPKVTVIKRSKDFSKFHRSNRKSKNCAIFYYKHVDTDNDQKNDGSEPPIVSSEASEEEIWEYTNTRNTPSKMDENLLLENCISLDDETCKENISVQPRNLSIVSNTSQLITKEALRELVLEAETLVRQQISDKSTNKPENSEGLLIKHQRKQQQKKIMDKNQKENTKIHRVQEWLKQNQNSNGVVVEQSVIIQQTDCEASGEYTSESEHSESSEEITDSVATCLQGITDPMQTSNENVLENVSPTHKVTMRTKVPNRKHSDRPWSVSCLSQLTKSSRQSLSDVKITEVSNTLANFSISESALNKLQKYKTTSESDSKNCNKNTINSTGSKNSLKKRKTKLRKKSLSSNKKSESGSDIQLSEYVPKNLLKTMTKAESFNATLMEDLSTAISMMSMMKKNSITISQAQRPESEDEQVMKAPDFKIGSITNVYGNPHNLGSLAALSNYNNDHCELNETGTENLSSFSEHNMWDNYMEKYNSEAYSEDRDVDGARKLLDFGDDYRNFIDSQSDCCSSLSAANQLDSLSPPRNRKNNLNKTSTSLPPNNVDRFRHHFQQSVPELPNVERYRERKNMLEKLCQKSSENKPMELTAKQISSSDDEDNGKKIVLESMKNLEETRSLRNANSQLLHAKDYEEIVKICVKNIKNLELALRNDDAGVEDSKLITDLISSWNQLLNWSENAATARRLQEDVISQKQLLDSFDVTNDWVLNSEEAIREKIDELNNTHEELYRHRSNMLKLNASVHSWLTRQEMSRNRNLNLNNSGEFESAQTTQSDLSTFADDELYKFLKDEIVSLYAKWDSINSNITSRLDNLKQSLVCWKQFENGFEEFQENLSKDLGALNNLKGAIEEGEATTPEKLVDNVQQVSKLLSEKLENRIQTISTNEDFMLHPEAALKFITNTSSNGSYQSDSGISDGGFSELSERERRLFALKKIAKQLESALSPSSEVLKTITKRMEAAENELKVLQNTCRELIFRTSTQLLKQQGVEIPSHAQSQINVQIPIITIKNKSKRTLPATRRIKRKSPSTGKKIANDSKVGRLFNDETSESDTDESNSKSSRWWLVKRIAKLAIPFQFTIITLFCISLLLEPRCCDTLNNLSMSLTPQLRYIKGNPPT